MIRLPRQAAPARSHWTRSRMLGVLLCVAAAPGCYRQAPQPGEESRVFVVSGFEPFAGRTQNASQVMARMVPDLDLRFQCVDVPVVWGAPERMLRALPAVPPVWVAFGEGTPGFEIESVALNRRRDLPDNLGNRPPTPEISPGADSRLTAAANLDAVAATLTRRGFPTTVSSDAGGFLCEEMLYVLLRENQRPGSHLRRVVFVHVPVLGATVAPAAPGSSLSRTVDAGYLREFGEALVAELAAAGWLPPDG